MTARAAILAVALVGCDSVFNLHRPPEIDAPPIDAAPPVCLLERVPAQLSSSVEVAGISAGELTGDTDIDLVVVNARNGTVSIFAGNGDGTFGGKRDVALLVGGESKVVVVANADDDALQDIITSNPSTNDLTVILRTPPGFNVVQELAEFAPTAIAVGLLDGNTRPDLAVTNVGGSGSITIHLATSPDTFADFTSLSGPGIPTVVAIADINGDMNADVIGGSANGAAYTYLGLGDGGFMAPVDLQLADPGPTAVVAAPFGSDAFIDLAFVGLGNRIVVFTNDGNGTFSGPVRYPVGLQPIAMVAVDITQDGLRDLVIANQQSATLTILAGSADGTFTMRPDAPAGNNPSGLVSADFNHDGTPDLAVANGTAGTVTVLLNHCVP